MIITNIENLNLTHGSHYECLIRCDLQISDKCKKEFTRPYKQIILYRKNNKNNEDLCLYCSRKLKHSGRKNPNTKYKDFDDNYFKNIDNINKAYFLGLIAAEGSIDYSNRIIIELIFDDGYILEKIKNILNIDCSFVWDEKRNRGILTICSKEACNDLCNILSIKNRSNKSYEIDLPKLDEDLTWSFIRGYFDGDGSVRSFVYKTSLNCKISSRSKNILKNIRDFTNMGGVLKTSILKEKEFYDLIFNKNEALNFLSKLYDNDDELFLIHKRNTYLKWKEKYENIC